MLDKITIRNFKLFETVEVELGDSVVLIGPNNSGKTSVLQALTLWDIGLRQWSAKRGNEKTPNARRGVAINRRDLITIPIPTANMIWRDTHVRSIQMKNGKPDTKNIRIDILVEGHSDDQYWKCGLEFDYSNDESFYCRPLRLEETKNPKRMPIPDMSQKLKVAYLPPMSGLADREYVKQEGEIGVLIGQGQTAQVLRNLCHKVFQQSKEDWESLRGKIDSIFGVKVLPPEYYPETSEIVMGFQAFSGKRLDLSCSGRGLQQTLLLLAHIYANPNSVLLLDEPDAHLEILRQRQIYSMLLEVASDQGSQIIAASHSEVILNEAMDRSTVIAFVGKPHKLNDKSSQVLKALKDIGFDQYYQAEQTGWVLYLESATDLAILKAFAEKLKHPSLEYLQKPFVHYVSCNIPKVARDHFFGLVEGKSDLLGVAIYDRLDKELQQHPQLKESMWRKCEIENYLCKEEVLLKFSEHETLGDLFKSGDKEIMRESIQELIEALEKIGKPNPWSDDIKATDEFLDPLFRNYSKKMNHPVMLRKNNYNKLVHFIDKDRIDSEVVEKLDLIHTIAKRAKSGGGA